jgi:hypothetical protein
MDLWYGFFGIENLALTAPQKAALLAKLKTLGPPHDPQPANLLQIRYRLDNEAAIYAARFVLDRINLAAAKIWLADLFDNVEPDDIDTAITTPSFGNFVSTVITFSYLSTNYLRMAIFGTFAGTRAQSGHEARSYIAAPARREAWEGSSP